MYKKLFIPGPIDVKEDVLEKMATKMIGHRTKDASKLQRGISDKLRIMFGTKEEILLSTSSGSGLMEGAIRCCTKKRAAVFSVGAFGKRWYEMALANGKEADLFESEFGHPTTPAMVKEALQTGKYDFVSVTMNETSTGVMNPVGEIGEVIKQYPDVVYAIDAVSCAGGVEMKVDEWGVDIAITSSQKALGLPPGLAVCTFSQKALERARSVEQRGYYLDLVQLYDFIQKKDYQYPSTPSLSHMFALDYQLDQMINVEGLEKRYKRHLEMAQYVRAWADRYFKVFPEKGYESVTLTCIENTRGISIKDLNSALGERGFMISNGYGPLKDKTFRIAHMADLTLEDVKELLENIEDILQL